ncbi:MAG: DHH family phosphoesterase [Salinarchaeum sp.]
MTATADGDVVYALPPEATADDLEPEQPYRAQVNGIVQYGVFVDLSESVSGLIHESNLTGEYSVGDEIVVTLEAQRDDGDLSFRDHDIELTEASLETLDIQSDRPHITAETLEEHVGEEVQIDGRVVQITQTGGPTVFYVQDGTGTAPATAFTDPGVRARPEIEQGDLVRVTGTVEQHDEDYQLEIEEVTPLDDDERATVVERIETGVSSTAAPESIDPLVDWPVLDALIDELRPVAEQLRRSILDRRPIWIRHHADGDGLCASVPVHRALEAFARAHHEDDDAPEHLIRRLPSKAPFYELEDSTRDLAQALEDRGRHGQQLPLVLMLDNGSTAEDTPAYETLRHYDVPIITVDHHHPDPGAVGDLLDQHVNPYLYGEDYRVTTGMMCVELARMIAPELSDTVRHLPAVAGLADRSSAEAMEDYLALAAEAGYDQADLESIVDAVDYTAYWLRYDTGRYLMDDLLGLPSDEERHEALIELLSAQATAATEEQLELAIPHVDHQTLENGVDLYMIDVDNYARRFTYPAPGTTTGAIHDRMIDEHGTPAITIGYGPDFAVLRSDGVRLDIPQMVTELDDGIVGGGISGGGHLVVGSLNFVSGRREAVLDSLTEKMADAAIDTTVGSGQTD